MDSNIKESLLGDSLAWKKVTSDEGRMLEDLQGNILKGHGREHTQNIFFSIDPKNPAEGRCFIRSVARWVKSARHQLNKAERYRLYHEDAGAFVGLMISANGYHALGIPNDKIPQDEAFLAGMEKRQDLLSDPNKKDWDDGFQSEIHGMILIGGKDESQVRTMRSNVLKNKPASVTIVGSETGLAMKNGNKDGIEHFGYVDGRSQPIFLKEDIQREAKKNGGIDKWNPDFPLKQVLVHCPGGQLKDLSFGSYFVFRKLEQNVKEFKELEEKIADRSKERAKDLHLDPDGDDELAGAMLVGRFENGIPVILSNTRVESAEVKVSPVSNNFNYEDDPQGSKCPFHSHIRKTNPRGESFGKPGVKDKTEAEERAHIMARRGITYGARNAKINADGLIIELKDKPIGGVGLLFMAYQSNIVNQFEFTQSAWANNPNFVKEGVTGIDPVIGQVKYSSISLEKPIFQKQPIKWGTDKREEIDFKGFVTMKGGEYFFAPSISFLKSL